MWLKVTLSHSILQQQQQSNIHIKFKAMDVGSTEKQADDYNIS